ncbi:cyanoglobin [Rhodobacter sp. KR11]|uniref:globin domain-containing protein n=1 Tax=Rhodobacter sp. KR11 TaxID=2974588 RepID=UPI0022227CF3|nr:cyanoglobin [Rhodobacter sp. KR11]MCW1920700.1 cyanoglobin [Rhodobacter sp. KR11]
MIDRIGGEGVLGALVTRFYDLVESDAQGARILQMHLEGHGLNHVRPEAFDFLSGFFGGRRYYAERHGHMSLREIHAHVAIRAEDAEAWLALMDRAMAETLPEPEARQIATAFRRAALALVNA